MQSVDIKSEVEHTLQL